MPRRRLWEDLSPNYQRRIENAYGLNAQFRYESGASLQRARGHKPREFARRREKNPLILSSNDYRFLRKQKERMGDRFGADMPARAEKFYRSLTANQRSLLRDRVANEARRYRQRGQVKLDRGPPRRQHSHAYGGSGGGSGGGSYGGGGGGGYYGSDYGDEPEDDLGGGYDADVIDRDEDFDDIDAYYESLEDDMPWFDDEMIGLAFYH